MPSRRGKVGVISAGVVGTALALTGCALTASPRDRSEMIRRVLPSAVQLRVDRGYGVRRAASGVVIAADPVRSRSWIVTTRHLLEPTGTQDVYLVVNAPKSPVRARVSALSSDSDLAMLEVDNLVLPPVTLKPACRLGDDVFIVAFPRGRRMTLVTGVVSQLASDGTFEGAASMVDAAVSYGASGGGVYDAATGELVGIVEGYRTGRVKLQDAPERVVEIPLPGETTVVSSLVILRFLETLGLESIAK